MERKIFVVINEAEIEITNTSVEALLPIAKKMGTDVHRLEKIVNDALDSFEDEQDKQEVNIYGAEHLIVRGHGYYKGE